MPDSVKLKAMVEPWYEPTTQASFRFEAADLPTRSVIVYSDRAEVKRVVTVSLAKGTNEIIIQVGRGPRFCALRDFQRFLWGRRGGYGVSVSREWRQGLLAEVADQVANFSAVACKSAGLRPYSAIS